MSKCAMTQLCTYEGMFMMTKEQLQAILMKDKTYDGKFYCGARTTRTVCLPSCAAKNCKIENIIIFDTLQDALKAGYHPCLRCRPDHLEWQGSHNELVSRTKALINTTYKEKFSINDLSGKLFVNGSYLARTFKKETGETLLSYFNSVRCEKAASLLARKDLSISFISSETGFCSASHFTKVFKDHYHCTPNEYRKRSNTAILKKTDSMEIKKSEQKQ